MRQLFLTLVRTATTHRITNTSKTVLPLVVYKKGYVQCSVRYFRTGTCYAFKRYVSVENTFAHSVFEKNPDYQKRIATNFALDTNTEEFEKIVNADWSECSAYSVANAFRVISQYGPDNSYDITNPMFENVCSALRQKCTEMTDSDLLSVLSCLSRWRETNSINDINFNVWEAIDKECEARIKKWDKDMLLHASDHWYKLNLAGCSQFVRQSNRKLGRRPTSLSPSQLVQTMFYMNLLRKQSVESMYELEYSLEQNIQNLSVNEIAVCVMGFFKTQSKLHSTNLVSKILDSIIENITTIDDIPLAALLKVIRYSLSVSLADKLHNLLTLLVDEIPRLSTLCCLHILLVGTNPQVFHSELMNAVSHRFSREIKTCRLKDLERLSLALCIFNYDPKTEPCIFESIINELRSPDRVQEINQYPKCLARLLYFLNWRCLYPLDIIEKVMDPIFISTTYGKSKFTIDREILGLDVNLELECPDYKGPRIDHNVRNFLAKKYSRKLPQEGKKGSIYDRVMMDSISTFKTIFGDSSYFTVTRVLPHYEHADIVFCLGLDGRPLQIPKEFSLQPLGTIKQPLPLQVGCKWYSVLVGSLNSYIRNTETPLGGVACKIRQLRLLGYHTEMLCGTELRTLGQKDKEVYVQNFLQELTAIPSFQIDH